MPSTALVKRPTEQSTDEEVVVDAVVSESPIASEITDALLAKIDELLAEKYDELKASAEQDDSKPFTLADAIREGAAVTEPNIGGWMGEKGEICALSAAMLAIRARQLA